MTSGLLSFTLDGLFHRADGMDLIFTLAAGLVLAVILQLLLANLGLALGASVVSLAPAAQPQNGPEDQPGAIEPEGINLPITHLVGLGIGLGQSTVLFVAGLLTTEFSQIVEPRRGIIFSLILWATYWLLFIWLSSTTLAGIADSLLGTALAGGRRLARALGGQAKPTSPEQAELRRLTQEISRLADSQAQQAETQLATLQQLGQPPVAAKPQPPEPETLWDRLGLPSGGQLARKALSQVNVADLAAGPLLGTAAALSSRDGAGDNGAGDDGGVWQRAADFLYQERSLVPEGFVEHIRRAAAASGELRHQLAALTPSDWASWLGDPGEIGQGHIDAIAAQLNQAKEVALATLGTPQRPELDTLEEKLIAYCRYTNGELLTPEGLTEKIHTQLQELGLEEDYGVADQIDLTAVEEILERRQGLEPSQHRRLVAALQTAWPQKPTSLAQSLTRRAASTMVTKAGDRLQETGQQMAEAVQESAIAARDAVETGATAVKTDLQQRADAARRQVAIAAWWLFISLVLSGTSAGFSGWLAVMY